VPLKANSRSPRKAANDMDRYAGGKLQEARLLVPCLPGKQGTLSRHARMLPLTS